MSNRTTAHSMLSFYANVFNNKKVFGDRLYTVTVTVKSVFVHNQSRFYNLLMSSLTPRTCQKLTFIII